MGVNELDTALTEMDVQVLREMNGEDTGMVGGAAMMVCASFLARRGYAAGTYHISQKGKDYLAFLDAEK